MRRCAWIELHLRFDFASMIMTSIAITLLYSTRFLAKCACNDTDLKEEFVRNCCVGNLYGTADHRCDSFEDSNGTWSVKSYNTFDNMFGTPCCTICVEREFDAEVRSEQTRQEQKLLNEEAKLNRNDSCFESCSFLNGRIIRVWNEKNRTERISVDDEDNDYNRSNNNVYKNDTHQWHCDSVFTSLNFWGANIVVFANAIYIIPYAIVVFVYFIIPGLGVRAYDKVVMCYNISQIILNGILISMGSCILCHVPLYPNVYVFVGLSLMFLTISSTFWLFVICIDMTFTITRCRWVSQIESNHQQEKKKFFIYAGWTWGGSLVPTILACIAELSPLLAESSSMRPNFAKFKDGANFAVILYVATFPFLTCLANTILFCYTSYRMFLIQKSTMLATTNSTSGALNANRARKRYFLYLRLYLLMDAPWVTSALAAAFTDLWLLKFLRMIQPILMLLAILPPKTITRARGCSCSRRRNRDCQLRKSIPISKIGGTV